MLSALQTSDAVALELDPLDTATTEQLAALAKQGAGLIPESLTPRVLHLLDTVCLPATTLAQFNPQIVFSTIGILQARPEQLEMGYGVEWILSSYARATNKPVIALETPASQMAAMQVSDAAMASADIEADLQELESGRALVQTRHLVQSWGDSNLADLEHYPIWCRCMDSAQERTALKKILEDRNAVLAKAIDALHTQGKSLFAAVGSLHMIGANGLPAHLQRRGYR